MSDATDAAVVRRSHTSGDTRSTATYSPCGAYRYSLTRIWNAEGPRLAFVMLNPSKATEMQNDPTVERCQRRALRLGYGAFCVCNLFGWRATDPADLRRAAAPIGPANDDAIAASARWSDTVIAAWGVHGAFRNRGADVARLIHRTGAPLFHLGLTKHGFPRHPLYLPNSAEPQQWHPDISD